MTDIAFTDKELEKAAEMAANKLAAWDLPGALEALAAVLGTAVAGPLAGATASGTAHLILRAVAKNATVRLLDEGNRIDSERALREQLAKHVRQGLRSCLSDELVGVLSKLDSLETEQRESHLRTLRFTNEWISELRDFIVRELRPTGPSDAALIREFKRQQVLAHSRLVLAGLFPGESPLELNQVFVDLGIADSDPTRNSAQTKVGVARKRVTLRELMACEVEHDEAARWVVQGDPGAGKSTLARHLAWELASNDNTQSSPLALFATLPELAQSGFDPFDLAEYQLKKVIGDGRASGLADALRRLGQDRGRLWLLLDGLDEVSRDHRERIQENLLVWAHEHPQVTIAVFSRRVGYEKIGGPFVGHAAVQPLDHDSQIQLLRGWGLDLERAKRILNGLSLGLKEACQLPLMATLLAYIATHASTDREGRDLPQSRRQLLEKSIDVLLRCGHRKTSNVGISEPKAAQRVLGELSLKLHELPEEGSWSFGQLTEVLAELKHDEQSVTRKHWCDVWQGPEKFFELLSHRTGILVPRDASGETWQFLHRQFHELLAAQALHEVVVSSSTTLIECVKTRVLGKGRIREHADVSRWAEVLGYACELESVPLAALEQLSQIDGELALRVLPELELVDPVAALDSLGTSNWDGDFLLKLTGRWLERGMPRADIVDWLWRQVNGRRSILQLSYFHYVLEKCGVQVDRVRFFTQCQKWPAPPLTNLVSVREGEFRMGSPEHEAHRMDNEAQHRVRIKGLEFCSKAVSNAEYERLDPQHPRELFDGKLTERYAAKHPVVNVSWWEARLYCAWVGGRLPTEAEWEYACRAGSNTPYSFGKRITPRQVNYNGSDPQLGRNFLNRESTVPTGSLPPNQWGIHEMHGNVYEWCEDWYGDYPTGTGTDPKGPTDGEGRVLRGGSWFDHAGLTRSAMRFITEPGMKAKNFGFRPVRDRAPA